MKVENIMSKVNTTKVANFIAKLNIELVEGAVIDVANNTAITLIKNPGRAARMLKAVLGKPAVKDLKSGIRVKLFAYGNNTIKIESSKGKPSGRLTLI